MLKKGDEIVTVGGMFGVVRRIGDDWIELEITKGTRVRFLKRAISQIVSEEEDEDEYEEYADEIEDGRRGRRGGRARGRGLGRRGAGRRRAAADEPAADEALAEPEAEAGRRSRPEPGPSKGDEMCTTRALQSLQGPRRAGIPACVPNSVLTWCRTRSESPWRMS